MKKVISINVDVEAWIAAKSKVENLSAYLNECILSLNGRTETDQTYEELKKELLECQNIIKETNIRQAIIQQSMKDLETTKAQKQAEMEELEKYQRWVCPVCKHQNFMENNRCDGCHLPTKTDSKTSVINIKGE